MKKSCPQIEYVAGRRQLVALGNEPGHHALFSLANGRCGIIASIDECASFPDLLMPDGYVSRPIHYHEAFPGYATATDTRVKCPSPVYFAVKLDGEVVDFDAAVCEENARRLDLMSGILHRTARWRLADGRRFEIAAERLVPVDGGAMVASSIEFRPVNFSANVVLQPDFGRSGPGSMHDDDPRISGAAEIDWESLPEQDGLFRFRGGGCEFACRQRLENADGEPVASGQIEAFVESGQLLAFRRIAAFSFRRRDEEALPPAGQMPSYDGLKSRQAELMARDAENMAVNIGGDEGLAGAITLNLWHLLQSASRNPAHSIAAKGLTGEGYEGHYFWDTEIFMLPALALQRPDLARNLILYRASVLDHARDHARSLGHGRGALYPWRTIAGRECSSHYPTGSAQYHINGDIAYALEFLTDATGDDDFLFEHCAGMLFETARLWIDVGTYSDRHGGDFCIFGVTGPDEYSAFVDNDHYTNAIARRHLRFAAKTARRMAELQPQAFGDLAADITLTMEEVEGWERAAARMHLPLDNRLGISPQDDAFLSKPFWPEGKSGREYGPLLLRHHPMELFRHQICKQGDVVQAMSLNLHPLPLTVKERNFAYYEAITTHDSTLSPVPCRIRDDGNRNRGI